MDPWRATTCAKASSDRAERNTASNWVSEVPPMPFGSGGLALDVTMLLGAIQFRFSNPALHLPRIVVPVFGPDKTPARISRNWVSNEPRLCHRLPRLHQPILPLRVDREGWFAVPGRLSSR